LIWVVSLFAVLPIGIRPNAEADPHSGWRGAPANPRLWLKVGLTTLIALVIWGGCILVIESDCLSFRSGWLAMHDY
jgi:predicted secreted protein